MQQVPPASGSDALDRARRLDGVIREVVRASRRLHHDILNSLGAPAGVLELLRDHPDLDEDEHHLIELAIAQLATLEAKIGALQAQVLRLDPDREAPPGPDQPRHSDGPAASLHRPNQR